MRTWKLGVILGTAALAACGQDTAPAGDAEQPAVEPAAERASADVFVEEVAPQAQLVFVGQDSSIRPADRADAVFVPFSTFSVERESIPNEFPAPDSMAAALEAAGVRGDVVIVGEPIPAGRAFAAFDYLGLADRASLLDGGPGALDGAGAGAGPDGAATEPAAEAPARGAPGEVEGLDVDVREDMIVDAEWVHARLEDPGVAILDARPPAEYSGDSPGDGVERPGHIPGARNVFWQTLVQSESNPRLKDEAELRRIFEAAGVEEGDTVVAYCRTGGQASFLYTVARHLGYDVRLYDGSFVDWSRTEYPVER